MGWQIYIDVGYLSQVVAGLLCVLVLYKILQHHFGKVGETGKSPQGTEEGRPLSILESLMDLSSQEFEGTGNICLIVTLRSKVKLLKDDVHKALVLLAKRQPMLRAVITTNPSGSTSSKDKRFKIIDVNEIADMIDLTGSNVEAGKWQDLWHDATSKQRGDGLLWRAVLLQEEFLSDTQDYANTVLFNFNHSCTDGVSSMEFCGQFLRYLNDVTTGACSVDNDIPSFRLLPCLDDLIARSRAWALWKFVIGYSTIRNLLNIVAKCFIRRGLSKKRNPFFAQYLSRSLPSNFLKPNQIICKVFSETETSNIVKRCRENGSTVTGALMAATHLAFCKLLQEETMRSEHGQLEHSFPVSGRRYCATKPPKEYVANLVTFVDSFRMQYLPDKEANFWKLAQEASSRIRSLVIEGKHVSENFVFSDLCEAEELLEMIVSVGNRQTLLNMSACNLVSSVGSFDFRDVQKLYKLNECLFTNLAHAFPGTFGHFNATVNGKMSWIILYDPSRVSSEHAETFSKCCFDYFVFA